MFGLQKFYKECTKYHGEEKDIFHFRLSICFIDLKVALHPIIIIFFNLKIFNSMFKTQLTYVF